VIGIVLKVDEEVDEGAMALFPRRTHK